MYSEINIKELIKLKYNTAKNYLKERPKLVAILVAAVVLLAIVHIH